jgi:hypothetical protein
MSITTSSHQRNPERGRHYGLQCSTVYIACTLPPIRAVQTDVTWRNKWVQITFTRPSVAFSSCSLSRATIDVTVLRSTHCISGFFFFETLQHCLNLSNVSTELTNYTELVLLKKLSHSASQNIPHLLWIPTVHYGVRKRSPSPQPCVTFRNMLFYSEELSSPHPTPWLKNYPLSVFRDCLFDSGLNTAFTTFFRFQLPIPILN